MLFRLKISALKNKKPGTSQRGGRRKRVVPGQYYKHQGGDYDDLREKI